MQIKLETLEHQTEALAAIDKAFKGVDTRTDDADADYVYANPLIYQRYKDEANVDIKMETGTGKTYVYTRLMYELHKKYGLFKFIIVVPTPSIKEGTKKLYY
ncbi:type III site-specific deoxyribonuclease [Lactobacillus pasteurii DSM 23907 = CRBIP 24.76]|uniref:Helicase/UvrB N-terminal domain-containing protein n=1 Tax=Lactobacillus pasteurii DSM 23907 = CRBIP 24.76 TaxID=1423790 RepID=I7LBF4_9LACO|nr:type III site-specific deoxyribonuclease [Lactobacillus pasteurii DSM 23907 = CRBIP 24.76]TDG77507.1 hypothetical protein C5L33_000950 [Lactobacillus pasteurii]CCI85531.1 Protein of unknown function [Lactobacillus pasteurii DSM 23907 = CRBIP 24.76]